MNQPRICLYLLPLIYLSQAYAQPVTINAVEQTLEVNGKKATVFNLVQPDGTEGFIGYKGDNFDVTLVNQTKVPISVHWHGIILPNDQDGVPYVTQLPISPGQSHHYHYKLLQSGTYWMHSHFKFHEQELMTAPMILKDHNDKYKADKDIVVMYQDFTFKNPEQIMFDLQHSPHSSMAMKMPMKDMKPDLNDVQYDAFLANRHTLRDPVIYKVQADEKIRLRLINGSSASNFWINTGTLNGTAIAVDGNGIHPFVGHQFQLAVAQRIDIEVTIPKEGGTFPILAQVEGTNDQAGVILTTSSSPNVNISEKADHIAPALNDEQEIRSHALHPLSKKKPTAVLNYKLTGDMVNYIWKINNEIWPKIKPLTIQKGDRVQMVFTNDTGMAHPMHLHGHVFQVDSINGNPLTNGPLRDTILVLPHTTKKISFDADNPGIWMLHCHVLYHMNAGMMTTTNYVGYPEPSYYKELISGKIKE